MEKQGELRPQCFFAALLLFFFFLLLIGLKAVLVTMASREEITVCEDEVR